MEILVIIKKKFKKMVGSALLCRLFSSFRELRLLFGYGAWVSHCSELGLLFGYGAWVSHCSGLCFRATHSSIFAWEIPWTEKSGRLQPMGS